MHIETTEKALSPGSLLMLHNGVKIPVFGFGTYQLPAGKEAVDAVSHALKTGYRLIDTAEIYGNEAEVGEAVRTSGIPRDELFITTKLWNSNHGYHETHQACEKSLTAMGLEYLDRYLIHWPDGGKICETWNAMNELVESGKCRAAGVSNFSIGDLEVLLEKSDKIPVVNQIEINPFTYPHELMNFCTGHGMALEAYSPLAQASNLQNPTLQQIAKGYDKTPAQIMLRWILQQEVIAIPKSSHAQRIEENANIFDFALTEDEMNKLGTLSSS